MLVTPQSPIAPNSSSSSRPTLGPSRTTISRDQRRLQGARTACSSGDVPPLRPFSEARRKHHIRQDSCHFGHARTFGFCADGEHRNSLRGEAEQGSISELGVLETTRRTCRNCILTSNHYHLSAACLPCRSCVRVRISRRRPRGDYKQSA